MRNRFTTQLLGQHSSFYCLSVSSGFHAVGAALIVVFAAITNGCTPLPPRDAAWPDAQVADNADASLRPERVESSFTPPNDCPFALRATDGHETRVTYLTPDDVDAQLRVFTSGVWDDGGVVVRHELRDRRGFETGHARYRCDARGLSLEALVADDQAIVFAPPLLVYPSVATSLASVGVATINDSVHAYTHTLSARAVAPLLELEADAGPWMEAAYVLELRGDGDGDGDGDESAPDARWEGTST
ncbi:MAG: hypothetical protein ACI82G_003154, partial [Bradymonadia bacterium]